MPLSTSVILLLSVLITAFISGIFGMVGGTILMGVLLALFPPAAAMAIHGLSQFTSNAWRAVLWRKYLYAKVLPGYFLGAGVAVGLFTAFQISFDLKYIYLFLGILPYAGLLTPKEKRLDITRGYTNVFCGLCIISLQLMAGVSGSFLDQSFIGSSLDRRQQIATKALIQVVAHLTKVVYFTFLLKNGADWNAMSISMIGMIIIISMTGNSLAVKPVQKMSQENFRRYSVWLMLVMGVYFLWRSAVLFLHS